jgi:hypothetical protein
VGPDAALPSDWLRVAAAAGIFAGLIVRAVSLLFLIWLTFAHLSS